MPVYASAILCFRRFGFLFGFTVFSIASSLGFSAGSLWAQSPGSVEFFEKRIRPVLVEHCYECHSAASEDVGGSLLLDSASGMMAGGDSGPAIAPGESEASMLISAIRYESSEMPPAGQLPAKVVRDFEAWIAAGAVDPRQDVTPPAAAGPEIDLDAGRKFWAFRPLQVSTVPRVDTALFGDSVRSLIDAFLAEKLAESGLRFRPLADPATRLRRLSFDLTGLPPSLELQTAWQRDPSREHWSRIVDALLASRAFGEHWARHWMDVARYADSNGSDFNATHHEAWRYRDYLVRSFAADRPFDQMIRQQIAGDLLPAANDSQRRDHVVATTFLMLGPKMLSERDKTKLTLDVVDEQIDTIGRAFMGMTLGCARCHDHKFDPIPTEDYYALAGIFKSTVTLNGESQKYVSTWNRVKLPTTAEHRTAVDEYERRRSEFNQQIKSAEKRLKRLQKEASAELDGIVVDDIKAKKTGFWKDSTYSPNYVGAGYVHDDNTNKGDASIRYAVRLPAAGDYEVRISYSSGSSRAAKVPIEIETAGGVKTVYADQRKVQIEPMWMSLGVFEFPSDRDAVVTLFNRSTSGYVIADAVQFLPKDETLAKEQAESSARSAAAKDSVKQPSPLEQAQAKLKQLKNQLALLEKNQPAPLPEAMAPSDRPTTEIDDSVIHIRGETRNLGTKVPRGFLQVCSSSGNASIRDPQGSGRRELADWLTDPDHPLTSRVFVNRIWMHLLGHGLVRTVDNFGTQGQRPTHPELLDYLATDFVRRGWQLKPLIRQIVTSHVYNQASTFDEKAAGVDPENRLLWRAHRRRLPAEAIRDAMLAAAGDLDRRPRTEPMQNRGTLVSKNNGDSKASFDQLSQPCRTLYVPVVRGYVPPLMISLDGADPDLLVGKRPTTNVPSQALVLINSPDVNRWTNEISKRVVNQASDFETRMDLAYRLCLQRPPRSSDRQLAVRYFEAESVEGVDRSTLWHQYIAALVAGTEFRLLD